VSQARDYRGEAFPLPVSMERRSRVRFPLELRVRFRTLGKSYAVAGIGSVVNMSSGGVLVAFQHEISAGTPVELNIEWPAALDGRVPLRLVAVGRVVRCETASFAVGLERHHFRTTAGTHLASNAWFGEYPQQAVKKASA
jgi:PilZ domain